MNIPLGRKKIDQFVTLEIPGDTGSDAVDEQMLFTPLTHFSLYGMHESIIACLSIFAEYWTQKM